MKQALPLLAILLVASSTFVRTTARTSATAGTPKAAIVPEQVTSVQSIPVDAKPETYSFTYARDGKTSTQASWASFRLSEPTYEVTPAIPSR